MITLKIGYKLTETAPWWSQKTVEMKIVRTQFQYHYIKNLIEMLMKRVNFTTNKVNMHVVKINFENTLLNFRLSVHEQTFDKWKKGSQHQHWLEIRVRIRSLNLFVIQPFITVLTYTIIDRNYDRYTNFITNLLSWSEICLISGISRPWFLFKNH